MIINKDKAISLLEQAVDTRGADYIYYHGTKDIVQEYGNPSPMKGCWYEMDGRPSCGVGLALHLAQVPISVLNAMDQVHGDTSISDVSSVLEDNGVQMTQEALRVFKKFQGLQDLNYTWGTALEAAKED